MNQHYSSYAALPVDRDLERLQSDLRALPTPCRQVHPPRLRRSAWARLFHLAPRHL